MPTVGEVEVTMRESLLQQQGSDVMSETQTRVPVSDEERLCAGEYRGYYNDDYQNTRWRPLSSAYGGRGGGHGGIDIYAPYFAYPLETPVFALCSGWMETNSATVRRGGLGNYVSITPYGPNRKAVLNHSFVYGHLNRFNGRPRRVKLGELIGFAGCTGNAESAKKECSTIGILNINSGHVHLQYERPTRPGERGTRRTDNPLDVLPWQFRFASGSLSESMTAEKWEPYRLPAPLVRRRDEGWLKVKRHTPEQLKKGNRATVLPGADLIDVDRREAIERTRSAYALATTRLGSTGLSQGVADYWDETIATSKELHAAMVRHRKEFDIPDDGNAEPSQERCAIVARFLLDVHLALWQILAGPILLKLVAARHKEKGAPPDSGIGLNGTTWIVVVDQAQSALQLSRQQNADGSMRSWTAAVTFGAGTEWHAVLDAPTHDSIPEARVKARAHVRNIERLIVCLMRLYKVVVANDRAINQREVNTVGVVTAFMTDVIDALKVVTAQAPLPTDVEEIGAFLRALFAEAEGACKAALLVFEGQHKKVERWTPQVNIISLIDDTEAAGLSDESS